MTPSDEKATPLKHSKTAGLDHKKATPLEIAQVNIHEDALKLDAEHITLLRPKRLSRIRHTRYKAWVGGHSLIYLPLEDA